MSLSSMVWRKKSAWETPDRTVAFVHVRGDAMVEASAAQLRKKLKRYMWLY